MNGFWVAAATEIASQTSEDFDILIVVSKAKYEKKLNGQTRFCQDGPNFVQFFDSIFLEKTLISNQNNMQKWVPPGKIWFGHSISFEILS